jgi:hypothetical protein
MRWNAAAGKPMTVQRGIEREAFAYRERFAASETSVALR